MLALQMGIAELRNQTQLQMPLQKLALPGEVEEGTLTFSSTLACPHETLNSSSLLLRS